MRGNLHFLCANICVHMALRPLCTSELCTLVFASWSKWPIPFENITHWKCSCLDNTVLLNVFCPLEVFPAHIWAQESFSPFYFSMCELAVFTKTPHMCASVVKSHMTWALHRPHWPASGRWHVGQECSSHWTASCVRGSRTERAWTLWLRRSLPVPEGRACCRERAPSQSAGWTRGAARWMGWRTRAQGEEARRTRAGCQERHNGWRRRGWCSPRLRRVGMLSQPSVQWRQGPALHSH